MENTMICLDTSVLIDYYRKKDKSKSLFFKLTGKYALFAASAVTEYELYIGNTEEQDIFWNNFFSKITVLPFDSRATRKAVSIYKQLKTQNKLIEVPDILIAGTAMQNNLPLATLNRSHFERINGLKIITD